MTDDSNVSHPDNLEFILAQSWDLLIKGVKDRRSGFHHPVLATIGVDGQPKSRVVILRGVDRVQRTIRIHTDIRTYKWQELSSNSVVSLSLYDEAEKVQLRLAGKAALHAGDGVAAEAWAGSQPMSKVAYGMKPAPGEKMESHDGFQLPSRDDPAALEAGRVNFGVLLVHLDSMEWLYLKVRGNRRALFDLKNNVSQWLVP